MGVCRYGISLTVFNSVSQEWDIKLNTRRDFLYLQATIYYYVYYINILMMMFLVIFRRFLTTFQRFRKLLQKLSVGHINNSEYFLNNLEDNWRFPKTLRNIWIYFDYTPTNLSTALGPNMISVKSSTDLPTLPVFPGVSKFFIKSSGLPVRVPNLPGTTYHGSFQFFSLISLFSRFQRGK